MNIVEMMKGFKQLQDDLETIEATGRSGSDMVVVVLNGKFEIKELSISEETLNTKDHTVITELIKAAFNDAVRKTHQQVQQNVSTANAGSILGNIFRNND